jgi:hypothetical protein
VSPRPALRSLLAATVAALASTSPRIAHAAAPSDAAPRATPTPALTPPRALAAGIVPYPAGGTGNAIVLVELVVDDDGHVTEPSVVAGDSPFAEATTAAAWHWRFDPARRGDRAVPSRIRMRVDFTAPRVAAAPPTPSPVATSPGVPEVTVRGTRAPDAPAVPTQTTLGGGEVREIPGAFGDAFRAIDALPGVTPMASGLPYYFVRGAPPGDTGYFIDGVRVPLLFHAAFGPSVIHPSLVDHVDFFPGGAPVQYGGSAGGVLAASLPEPASRPHGEGIVRVFDAGALVESPFADGRGSALVAGRYSYSGLILSLTSPIKLAYWDYQARATWKFDDKNQIGIFAFGSYDDFAQVVAGVTDTIIDGEFHRVDVRYDRSLDNGTARVATTFGYGRSSNDDNAIRDLTAGARASVEERLSPTMTFHAGSDVTVDRYDLLAGASAAGKYEKTVTNILYPSHVDVGIGGYADVVWQLGPRVQIVPGVRADLFNPNRFDNISAELRSIGMSGVPVTTTVLPSIDPRLSTRVELTPRVALLSSVAIAHQPPAFVVPIPGLTFVEPNPVLQTAIQMSQGVVVKLPESFELQATGFLHSYLDLTDLTATCSSVFGAGVLLGNAPQLTNNLCLVDHVRGEAFGGELSLRRSLTRRLSGWVSYTLSRSTRETTVTDRVGGISESPVLSMPSAFDRTHVVSVVGAYDLGREWRAGARFVAYSGLPYTNSRDYVPVAPYNGERMPAFYRIDLRLEKRWRLSDDATLALVFEGMNVTLNKEVLGVTCAPTLGRTANGLDGCTFLTLGPVSVPSVGLEGIF